MQTMRRAGCGWFTTILGPGDPDHADHFHFDILRHGASDVLERIAREAVAPYFDADLRGARPGRRAIWRRRVRAEIATRVDEEQVDVLKDRARDAVDELRAVNADLSVIADSVEIGGPPDLPGRAQGVVGPAS